MGHSSLRASTSTLRRSHDTRHEAQHERETPYHDPILGQLVRKYLAGQIELTQPVLVGLHRSLGSPARVHEAIEGRKRAQASPTPHGEHGTEASPTPHGEHETEASPTPHGEHGTEGAHASHSPLKTIQHGLHNLEAAELLAHFVERASHEASAVKNAMALLDSGVHSKEAFTTISHALAAEQKITGQLTALVGKAAAPVLNDLAGGALGKALGKGCAVLSNPLVSKGMTVASAGLAGYHGYKEASSTSQLGKLAVGAGASLASIAIGTNPALLIADAVLPRSLKPSAALNGAFDSITAVAEGLITWDERSMAKAHDRALRGDFSCVGKAAAWVGDVIADQL